MTKQRPIFKLEEFFAGKLKGWGIQRSRFGHLQSQFFIEAAGEWNAERQKLLLNEKYRFDDGRIDDLQWSIEKLSNTDYRGHEKRVEGEASGEQRQNWFRWRYKRQLPEGGGNFDFDDVFYLIEPSILVVQASVRKMFVELATISVFYQKLE